MSFPESYRAITLITEEEMWQLRNNNPKETGVPRHYSITRYGGVVFFPAIDPAKCHLMCAEGAV